MITAIRIIMAVGLIAWLVGCTKPGFEGTWVGTRKLEGPEHIVGTAGRVELKLERTGRYSIIIHSLPVEGKYEVAGKRITFTPQQAAGRDLIPSEGESLLGEGSFAEFDGEDLIFTDSRGPDPTPLRLTPKPEANPARKP